MVPTLEPSVLTTRPRSGSRLVPIIVNPLRVGYLGRPNIAVATQPKDPVAPHAL